MGTVLVKDAQQTLVSAAAEAIIEEARHRQHRRWFWTAMAAAVVALVIGLALAFSVGGATSSSHGHVATRPTGSLAFGGPRTTVEGSFLMTWGTATGGHHKTISGTIRFVADNGRKTYTTKANNGHWNIRLPAGTYTVQGLSAQVPGGRHWSAPVHLVVRAGQTATNVHVEYYIPTG